MSASESDPKITSLDRQQMEAIAADWLVARDRGWTEDEQCNFERWLSADARHAQVWSATERAWSRLDRMYELPEVVRQTSHPVSRRRHTAWLAVMSAAAVLAIGVFWRVAPDQFAQSGVVRIMPTQQLLPDGTQVELNADSEILTQYTAMERRVQLVKGEAHFAVKKDVTRPFVVDAAGVAVQAVGTGFIVRLAESGVGVLVTEGRVRVSQMIDTRSMTRATGHGNPGVGAPTFLDVELSQQVFVPLERVVAASTVVTVSPAELAQALDWKGLRLRFQDMPLNAVAAEFNLHSGRHRTPRLVVEDTAANILVAGTFRADNVEVFVQFLERGFGIAVERRGQNTIVLRSSR